MMENFTFGLVFGGVTGIIAAIVIAFIIAVIVTVQKEETDKKKKNFLIHFTCVNKNTNEPLEDTATVIGAESQEEAIEFLQQYLNKCERKSATPVKWIIEGTPQVFDFGNSNVICTRYYG